MNNSTIAVGIYLVSILISVISQILLKVSANKTYSSPIREYLNYLGHLDDQHDHVTGYRYDDCHDVQYQ